MREIIVEYMAFWADVEPKSPITKPGQLGHAIVNTSMLSTHMSMLLNNNKQSLDQLACMPTQKSNLITLVAINMSPT